LCEAGARDGIIFESLAGRERMSSGRLKVFDTLQNWLTEFRIYRRDQKGRILKENDHLLDATRYLVMSGLARAASKAVRASARQRLAPRAAQQQQTHQRLRSDALRRRAPIVAG
jgi:hypothetical protein